MSLLETFRPLRSEMTKWRHRFHQHPELLYATTWTAGEVAARLRAFGVDHVETGIGQTGVVGVITGRSPARATGCRVVGLRADMDALPIEEETDLPHASLIPGQMHACGHDGHTTMLLGAARYFAQERAFSGKVVVIFQPAEEGGAGARAMIEDGLMDRFEIEEVYGLHNLPGLPIGHFATRPGTLMAAVDTLEITLIGKGGHAAWPQDACNPLFIAAHCVVGLPNLLAQIVSPLDSIVLNITLLHAGTANNVIPQKAQISGTLRSLCPHLRAFVQERVIRFVGATAESFGAHAEIAFIPGYPMTINHSTHLKFALRAAEEVGGSEAVERSMAPLMGAEDFSYMLQERPGAFVFIGNGASQGLHHPAYDFNDAALPYGCAYWAALIQERLPL